MVAFPGFDLETCFNHVKGRAEVRGGHAGYCTGGEELEDAEFFGGGFAEEVRFEVGVGGEVDGGEGD